MPSLLVAFAQVPDPRSRRGRSYPLPPILALLALGILLGRRSLTAITQLTQDYGAEFALLLGFPRARVPTVSNLSKLLPRLDAAALEAVLTAWIADCLRDLPPAPDEPPAPAPLLVNLDGKTVRGSADPAAGLPGVHLLSAFAPRAQAVLAQLRVDGKTNEHKAALELLKILPPRPGGYLFTGDAIFCQTEVCQAIRARGDHYVLTVKDNQPGLAIDIAAGLAFAQTAATFSPGRGPHGPHRSGPRADLRHHDREAARAGGTPQPGEHDDPDADVALAGAAAGLPRAPARHPGRPAV
jgi:hypothetical protein